MQNLQKKLENINS